MATWREGRGRGRGGRGEGRVKGRGGSGVGRWTNISKWDRGVKRTRR